MTRRGPIDEAMDHIGAAFVMLGRCLRDGLRAEQRSAYGLAPPPESPAVHGEADEPEARERTRYSAGLGGRPIRRGVGR